MGIIHGQLDKMKIQTARTGGARACGKPLMMAGAMKAGGMVTHSTKMAGTTGSMLGMDVTTGMAASWQTRQ